MDNGVREHASDRAATVRPIYGAGVNLIDVGSLVRGAPPIRRRGSDLGIDLSSFLQLFVILPYHKQPGLGLGGKVNFIMTRDEALELLKSGEDGVGQWNEWRRENPVVGRQLPNLKGADLRSARLNGVVLNHINLEAADLGGAGLEEATFGHANLRGANLRDAHL